MDPTATSSSSTSSPWASLSFDLTELILSYLPLPAAVRAAAVCKHWRALLSDPSFKTLTRKPLFFLYGQNNICLKQNQSFAFDPHSNSWIRIPTSPLTHTSFTGAAGYLFSSAAAAVFLISPLLSDGPHIQTPPLLYPCLNPLVALFDNNSKILVVGGSRFVGGLVDIEDQVALVEVYDPVEGSWAIGPPLPSQFSANNSSQWLCSALLFDRLFFVFGIFSNILCAFDLVEMKWMGVRTLRPPGVLFSFLIACRDRLILAGLCSASFKLWEVDYWTGEYREIGAMPKELMGCLFDGDDEDAKYASLKCVGLDGVLYVFNEDHCEGYPACVCEIGEDMVCSWRKMPPLPEPMNRFHKVVAFCSDVPLCSVLAAAHPPPPLN